MRDVAYFSAHSLAEVFIQFSSIKKSKIFYCTIILSSLFLVYRNFLAYLS